MRCFCVDTGEAESFVLLQPSAMTVLHLCEQAMEMYSNAQEEDMEGMGDGDEGGGVSEGVTLPTPAQLDAEIQSAQAAAAEMEEEEQGRAGVYTFLTFYMISRVSQYAMRLQWGMYSIASILHTSQNNLHFFAQDLTPYFVVADAFDHEAN